MLSVAEKYEGGWLWCSDVSVCASLAREQSGRREHDRFHLAVAVLKCGRVMWLKDDLIRHVMEMEIR